MRTSLNEIKQIESFLLGTMDHSDALLFEAKVLTQPTVKTNLKLQQKIYRLIKLFHRKRMKNDLEEVHDNLFADPLKADFQQSIHQLFKS